MLPGCKQEENEDHELRSKIVLEQYESSYEIVKRCHDNPFQHFGGLYSES